ncbi:bacteriophage N4 adsorption protein A [Paraburkholderia sp. CNPSo 3157]|uniref:Bacteriophage N4 adsorption protein A n=1 Tax=Paraburkholderia franconis TaxID=2654983 RepID=A0A7X1NG78_9BURK|nr:bacteriophage N4 adsorption protein A [Paraburkholderia franconis]
MIPFLINEQRALACALGLACATMYASVATAVETSRAPRPQTAFGTSTPAPLAATVATQRNTSSTETTNELPLSGAAYRVAQRAYAEYDARDYSRSADSAAEAIRQRPDVLSLRLLRANALAADHRYTDALRTVSEAMKDFGPEPALVSLRESIQRIMPAPRKPHTTAVASVQPADLAGPALVAAQRAYDASAKGDYAIAAQSAHEAVTLRPTIMRLRLLEIDALLGSGNIEAAWQAQADAARLLGDTDELRKRRAYIGDELAKQSATKALDARRRGDVAEATVFARQASTYAPERASYRLQLMESLLAQNDLAGLSGVAGDAIASDAGKTTPYVLRGYARMAQGDATGADADFASALQQPDTSERQQRLARLIVADVWLAQAKPQRTLDVLASLDMKGDDTDALITWRRRQAQMALATATPEHSTTPKPILDCTIDSFGAWCEIEPSDPAYAVSRAASKALATGDRSAALDLSREAVQLAPDNPQHRLELITALDNHGDRAGANAEAISLVNAGMLDAMPDMPAAYIAQRARKPGLAYNHFAAADLEGKLPPSAAADAAYSAQQVHHNHDSARYFERAIDYADADEGTATTPQALHDMRAAHADVTRNWGADFAIGYRGAGMQSSFAAAPIPRTSNNWQAGGEIYWRPFGSLGDRKFEVYARGSDSFGVQGQGNPSGVSTLTSAVGARAKPLAQVNAIGAFERVFAIGSHAQSDWLARLAYSGGFGTERRIDAPSWWTTDIYTEFGRYVNHETTYATGSVRFGRSWRVDPVSPRLTTFAYGVAGIDYDTSVDHSWPVGAGVGVSARYWMRDSQYDAPRSFVDLSLQYRFKVSGDDRARGVFFIAVYSY